MTDRRMKRGESVPASEATRHIAAMLKRELESWPGVNVRPFFGMFGVWRGERIFAALPRTRTVGKDGAVMFKLAGAGDRQMKRLAEDPRIDTFIGKKAGWHRFSIRSEADLRDLLVWLAEAAEGK